MVVVVEQPLERPAVVVGEALQLSTAARCGGGGAGGGGGSGGGSGLACGRACEPCSTREGAGSKCNK